LHDADQKLIKNQNPKENELPAFVIQKVSQHQGEKDVNEEKHDAQRQDFSHVSFNQIRMLRHIFGVVIGDS
jgi:hypothetical protein